MELWELLGQLEDIENAITYGYVQGLDEDSAVTAGAMLSETLSVLYNAESESGSISRSEEAYDD